MSLVSSLEVLTFSNIIITPLYNLCKTYNLSTTTLNSDSFVLNILIIGSLHFFWKILRKIWNFSFAFHNNIQPQTTWGAYFSESNQLLKSSGISFKSQYYIL